jgi:hypothetical protein
VVFELYIVLGSVIVSSKVCARDVIGVGGIICELLLLKTRAQRVPAEKPSKLRLDEL